MYTVIHVAGKPVQVEEYRGFIVRHPTPAAKAIDPRAFGYLSPALAEQCRKARDNAHAQ